MASSKIEDSDGPHAYGDYLADRFYLEKPKSHVTRSRQRGVLAVTQLKQYCATPDPSQSIAYDEAYLIGLMVSDVPNHQLWQEGRAVKTESFKAGATILLDLRRNPTNLTSTATNSLHFYLPRTVLLELAEQQNLRFTGELNYTFASGYDDPVVRHLGLGLLPALERGQPIDGLFLDHVLYAVGAHVVERYGEVGAKMRLASGGLASWQQRRAMELMSDSLGSDDMSLKQIAQECGLSVAHFARAFRQSLQTSPHRWRLERRIEKAQTMLSREQASLADIALACGFADQSHFTKVFTKQIGTSPGQWRRVIGSGSLHQSGPSMGVERQSPDEQ
jgi:AraC family transcriptional regulator